MLKATSTSDRVFNALRELHGALNAEYGSDYSYVVLGRGHILAASNLQDGYVKPQSKDREEEAE